MLNNNAYERILEKARMIIKAQDEHKPLLISKAFEVMVLARKRLDAYERTST